ncbi:MAG: ComEC family competence protein [Bacteroidetes bacterium]|nr:ComEC family competence protein [Bacteroidota bacterium]
MSFYEFLRSAPYIRLLLPFIIAIITGQYINLPILLISGIVIFSFCCFSCLKLSKKYNTYQNRWLWGFIFCFFMFSSGLLIVQLKENREFLPGGKKLIVTGTVMENPRVTPKTLQVMIKLSGYFDSGKWVKSGQKVVVSIQKSSSGDSLAMNQVVMLQGYWNEFKNNGNPYEFDYKKYMNRSGYYYTAYIDSSSWLITGKNLHFNLAIFAHRLRDNLLDYFRQLNLSSSAFAVISALTVGDKSYLDAGLKSAYVNSGTMHILAVSGMHVALLFWLLQQLTRPLMLWRHGPVLRAILVLFVIWVYALITGLTPSVIRASVMFTFWMIGDTGKRNTNIYNTLASSAFLLLLLNPDTLFDVGFQLSYLAVLGIVVFYKDIYNWLYVNNIVLKYFWSAISVSLAAQLLTLPVSLYNFHQFPNYFLLSNIIALPLSTVILYGSIVALMLAPFKFMWFVTGWFLKYW